MTRARKENREVLVLSDTNSHSQALWGGKDTNPRGIKWEEFLERNGNLSVINKGDKFTFVTARGQSIIDVTLATPKVAGATKFWEVTDYVPASDHLAISFILHIGGGWTIPDRGWDLKGMSEEAWDKFTNMMEELSTHLDDLDTTWNSADLDREANKFLSDMAACLDKHAKRLVTRVNIKPLLWWDKKCAGLHHRMKVIRQYLRNRKTARNKRGIPFTPFDPARYTYADYITARKAFKRHSRKVKRRFWRRMVANILDTEETAKLKKRLGRENNASLGLFTNEDGSKCTPKQST